MTFFYHLNKRNNENILYLLQNFDRIDDDIIYLILLNTEEFNFLFRLNSNIKKRTTYCPSKSQIFFFVIKYYIELYIFSHFNGLLSLY